MKQNFSSERSFITSYCFHPQHGNKAAWLSDDFNLFLEVFCFVFFCFFVFLCFVLLRMAIDLMNSEYCSGYIKNYLCEKPSIYELLQSYKTENFKDMFNLCKYIYFSLSMKLSEVPGYMICIYFFFFFVVDFVLLTKSYFLFIFVHWSPVNHPLLFYDMFI